MRSTWAAPFVPEPRNTTGPLKRPMHAAAHLADASKTSLWRSIFFVASEWMLASRMTLSPSISFILFVASECSLAARMTLSPFTSFT